LATKLQSLVQFDSDHVQVAHKPIIERGAALAGTDPEYRGGVLPPATALSRDVVALGVSEKQKDRARLVFECSAEQAGFFEHGKQRLVMPGVAYQPDGARANECEKPEPGNGGGGGLRRSIQSSLGYWHVCRRLEMYGQRRSVTFGLSF
jgi:hypothetical protein